MSEETPMTESKPPPSAADVVQTLRANREALRQRGVLHASVFGSVVRGEAGADSDIDILIDIAPDRPMGMFEYTRVTLDIADLFDRPTDVVERKRLSPALRDRVIRESVDAF